MTFWRQNCASKFEANKAVNDVGELRLSPWPPKKNTATFLANTSDLEKQQKVKKPCIMKRLS
jgi:hypothetical protein